MTGQQDGASSPQRMPWVWGDPFHVEVPADQQPAWVVTRSVATTATTDALWLWLCQLRRAPYSYDWVDNMGRRSPRTPDPALTDLERGQTVMTIFTLVDFEPGRSITLAMKPGGPTTAFGPITVRYEVAPGEPVRHLRAGMWMRREERRLGRLRQELLGWGDLVMIRKQLLTLARLAEGGAGVSPCPTE